VAYPLDNETGQGKHETTRVFVLGDLLRIARGIGGHEESTQRILESKRPIAISRQSPGPNPRWHKNPISHIPISRWKIVVTHSCKAWFENTWLWTT